jgi:hypothetical protein
MQYLFSSFFFFILNLFIFGDFIIYNPGNYNMSRKRNPLLLRAFCVRCIKIEGTFVKRSGKDTQIGRETDTQALLLGILIRGKGHGAERRCWGAWVRVHVHRERKRKHELLLYCTLVCS